MTKAASAAAAAAAMMRTDADRAPEKERERRGCLCVTDSARLAAAADDGEMEKVSGRTAGKEEEEEE